MAKKEKVSSLKQDVSSAVLTIGVFLVVFGVGLLLNTQWSGNTGTPGLPAADEVVTTTTEQPVETKPTYDSIFHYRVPADQPRTITIYSAEVYAPIQSVGLTEDDAMAVPSNIHFAGWYVNSVKPGEPGLSIINGHYSGIYNDAVFVKLNGMKVGDEIEIEFGDKSVKTFAVVETITIPEKESSAKLFEERSDITSQLNLITCGGKFNKATQTYTDRVIIVSRLKS